MPRRVAADTSVVSPSTITPDGAAEQWETDARRARRLQRVQVIVIGVCGLIALVATVVFARQIMSQADEYAADQKVVSTVTTLHVQLLQEHRLFWKRVAAGESGIGPSTLILANQGPTLLRSVIKEDVTTSPDERRVQQQLLTVSDGLASRVRERPSTDPRTPAGRAFIAEADRTVGEITDLVDQWVTLEREGMLQRTLDGRRTSHQAAIVVGSLVALLTLLVVLASIFLNRWRTHMVDALRQSARRLADRAASDPLTGLMNHAVFHERLRTAVAAAHRDRTPLGLILIDLDHFKSINDTLGHPVGDQVLLDVARRLREHSGPRDVVARVGGEEFAWLRPGADAEDAFAAAESLREEVAASAIGPVRTLTISSGVCDLSRGGTARELYELADGALYWAKAHGRNITFQYSPDVVEELSVEERAARLERLAAVNAVRALAKAVDAKDPFTHRHSERVGQVAQDLARELGWSEPAAADLFEAALMHDVGKIGIPDAILSKPGRLDDREMALMRTHAALSAQIVSGVLDDDQVGWIRGHHEFMDGSGYPDGLAGETIPEGARILALADAWDAMTGARPYSTPRSAEAALEECRRCAGTQFWSDAVDALERVMRTRHSARSTTAVGVRNDSDRAG